MVDPTLGYELGKGQLEMVKAQMETEQYNLAEMVQMELEEHGYPCKIEDAGTQRMRAGVFPVKISKLKIVPLEDLNYDGQIEFDRMKLKLTKEYSGIRKDQMKEEIDKLKKKKKNKK